MLQLSCVQLSCYVCSVVCYVAVELCAVCVCVCMCELLCCTCVNMLLVFKKTSEL